LRHDLGGGEFVVEEPSLLWGTRTVDLVVDAVKGVKQGDEVVQFSVDALLEVVFVGVVVCIGRQGDGADIGVERLSRAFVLDEFDASVLVGF